MVKWIMSGALGVLFSFLSFAFMSSLIHKPKPMMLHSSPIYEPKITLRPEIVKPKPSPKMVKLTKTTPPPAAPQETPRETDNQPFYSDQKGDLNWAIGNRFTSEPRIFEQITPDKDAVPIIRVEPIYPRQALLQQIQGWVELSFSIDKLGNVTNISIVDAYPKQVFSSAAKHALKRWKYNPKFINGTPVIQSDQRVRLEFSLPSD